MKLSIIVPCFNESKNIPLILQKFDRVIKRNDIEIIFVNNGSQDDTQAVFDKLIPRYNFARVIAVSKNQGYGFGITSGLFEANGEFVGYTHADMQTDPADVIKALEIAEKQIHPDNTYIKGLRKGRPILDEVFTKGMSIFETFYLGMKLWDINAQPNIFHKSFFDNIKDNCPKDFSLDLYFLYMAKKRRLNLIRFDVSFPQRQHGKSSWNNGLASKWSFIKRTLDFSIKLKKEL
jgi:polyisoprenyl-phosphate glycosyltransferase